MGIEYVEAEIRRMKPGQRLRVGREAFERYDATAAMSTPFTAADRILERIVGSGYEYGYEVSESDRRDHTVTFFRLEKPTEDGVRSYVSPDRRARYVKHGQLYYPSGR